MAAELAPLVQAACASAELIQAPAAAVNSPSESRRLDDGTATFDCEQEGEEGEGEEYEEEQSQDSVANKPPQQSQLLAHGETPHCGEPGNKAGRLCSSGSKKGEFVCQVCSKSFKGRIGLRRHMHLHTGQSPYQCDQCSASFGYIGNLKRHLRIHTGEKPFSCKYCGRAFSDDSHRRSHEKIHRLGDGHDHAVVHHVPSKATRTQHTSGSDDNGAPDATTTTTTAAAAAAHSQRAPAVGSRPRSMRAAAARRRRVPRDGSSDSEDPYVTDDAAEDDGEERRVSGSAAERVATVPTTHKAAASAKKNVTPHASTPSHNDRDDALPVSSACSPAAAPAAPAAPATATVSTAPSQQTQQYQQYPQPGQQQQQQQQQQHYLLPAGAAPTYSFAPACASTPSPTAPMYMAPSTSMYAAGPPPMPTPEAAMMYQRIMQAHMQSFALMAAQYGLPPPQPLPPHMSNMPSTPYPVNPHTSVGTAGASTGNAPPTHMPPAMFSMPMPYYQAPPPWAAHPHSHPLSHHLLPSGANAQGAASMHAPQVAQPAHQ